MSILEIEFSEWEIIIRLLSNLVVFEISISKCDSIRSYIFGMGKWTEIETAIKYSRQNSTKDLQIEKQKISEDW